MTAKSRSLVLVALWCCRIAGLEAAEPTPAAVVGKLPEKSSVEALRRELEAMLETDQAQRSKMDKVRQEHGQNSPEMTALWDQQKASDLANIKRLEEIIAEIGWPKRSVLGDKAASAAFLIVQHADLSYQKKYLPLARAAVAANEMRGSSLALLEDRILLREGKKQIYGSQVTQNAAGQWEAMSLEDPANVDQRRASVGLQPLADYLAGFAQRAGGTVDNGKGNAPSPNAPPLTQKLFEAGDDAKAAYAKLMVIKPQGGDAGVQLQFACRDFCARFPDSALYAPVRIMAARYWGWLREPDLAQLKDWDPLGAEHDPKLSSEQQASVSVHLALLRADKESARGGYAWADRRFEAVVATARAHRGTIAAREGIIAAALDVASEKALPVLRELYPDNASVAAATKVIAAMGQPCEFQLTTLDGRSLTARDFRGKVTLLLFSTAEARATAGVMAPLRQLAEKDESHGFVVAWVSMDRDRSAVEECLKQLALDWPAHFDGLGWNTPLAARFLIKLIPYYLLIDRQGVLRYRGMVPGSAEAAQRIQTLLAEAPPPAKT